VGTLRDFGKILLDHVAHRSDRINAQSATVLAWATAILAFLFVNANRFSGNLLYLMFASATFSIAAVIFSFTALRTRKHWKWPSDQSWIHETGLIK
jgi:hypothetical protein